MTESQIRDAVLSSVRRSGRVRPSVLVERVTKRTQHSKHEVREALRTLVDCRLIMLNWQGELEAGKQARPS